jgi:hypothetical protein
MNDQTPPPIPKQKPLGCAPYAIGGFSFIPLLGVPLGLFAIVWGLIKLKHGGWKVAILGAMGISFTIALYGTIFYQGFVKRDGIFAGPRRQMAEQMLVSVIKEVEFYKLQNGEYPQSLKDVEPKGKPQGLVSIYDPSQVWLGNKAPTLFYYELTDGGANYYLFSVGSDGMPFTEDDVYPALDKTQMKSVGYIRPANHRLEATGDPLRGSPAPQP